MVTLPNDWVPVQTSLGPEYAECRYRTFSCLLDAARDEREKEGKGEEEEGPLTRLQDLGVEHFKKMLLATREVVVILGIEMIQEIFVEKMVEKFPILGVKKMKGINDFAELYCNGKNDKVMRKMVEWACHGLWGMNNHCLGVAETKIMERLGMEYSRTWANGERIKRNHGSGNIKHILVKKKNSMLDVIQH